MIVQILSVLGVTAAILLAATLFFRLLIFVLKDDIRGIHRHRKG
jgi:hypothetical protein